MDPLPPATTLPPSVPPVPTVPTLPTLPIEQPAIKYESPYSNTAPPYDPNAAALKRRYSETVTNTQENDEKRQRVEPAPSFTDDLDFAAMIAQAAASAQQEVENVPQYQHHHDPNQHQHQAHTFDTGVQTHQQLQQPDYGQQQAQQQPEVTNAAFLSDPHLYMRICSLPILDSLSTQILATLAQGPYSETIKIITQPDSELGQTYQTLKSLFDQTKKIYSQQKPFLSADELNIREADHRSTIRITNLATFASSVFGGQDVGFYELNDHFIDTFVPDGGELTQEPGQLYLNLKTQMYLSAMSSEEQEKTKEETLEDLFPANLADTIRSRHIGMDLTPSELQFINDANERKKQLQNDAGDADSISALSEQFAWEDFLRSLSDHLKHAYEPLLAPYMRKHALTAPPPSIHPPAPVHHAESEAQNSLQQSQNNEPELDLDIDIEQATRDATQHALQSVGYTQYDGSQQQHQQHQQQPPNPHQQHMQMQQHQPQMNGYGQQPYPAGAVPYHTQTAPTQVLYEQARQAAVAKASPHSRRPGLPSQRRPWSTEEENALMAGLDQVKGPHWSQILALYGAKGQVSEILKDRNQVQLKDKARNLKLFFLKSNIEVPYYLQCVTGELKTRAPSQAARKEAEERARLASDEEQARFHGIMALAGGMQEQHPQHPPPQQQQQHEMQHQHDLHSHPQQMEPYPRNDVPQQHQQHQQPDANGYHGQHSQQHSVHHSPVGTGTPHLGAQQQQQQQQSGMPQQEMQQQPRQQEVSQTEFEDQLGARLMESLENHKRATSEAANANPQA